MYNKHKVAGALALPATRRLLLLGELGYLRILVGLVVGILLDPLPDNAAHRIRVRGLSGGVVRDGANDGVRTDRGTGGTTIDAATQAGALNGPLHAAGDKALHAGRRLLRLDNLAPLGGHAGDVGIGVGWLRAVALLQELDWHVNFIKKWINFEEGPTSVWVCRSRVITGNQSLGKLMCQGSEPTITAGKASAGALLLLLVATSAISTSVSVSRG